MKRTTFIFKGDTAKTTFFSGSRIPFSFLIDYIKEGYGISDFLSSYPWIKRRDVNRKLDYLKNDVNKKCSIPSYAS